MRNQVEMVQNQCETCRFGGHREKGCMAASCTPRYAPKEGCPLYAMSAQAFMQRVVNAQRRIVNMEELAARYRDRALRVTGQISAVRVSGSFSGNRIEENAGAFMDICRDIEMEAEKLRGFIRDANAVIGRLSDMQEREVLELRYLSGLSWEKVAERMFFNERSVRRIHVKALEHVQREMDLMEYAVNRPGWNPGGAAARAVQYVQ